LNAGIIKDIVEKLDAIEKERQEHIKITGRLKKEQLKIIRLVQEPV
jgi:hypothetical protein